MHPLVQYGHDTDVAIAKLLPVDEVLLVAEKEPFDTELDSVPPRGVGSWLTSLFV